MGFTRTSPILSVMENKILAAEGHGGGEKEGCRTARTTKKATLCQSKLSTTIVVRFRWFTKELVPTPTLSTDHSLLHVRHVTQPDIRPTPRHVTAHQATMIHVPALQASSPSIRQDLAETSETNDGRSVL